MILYVLYLTKLETVLAQTVGKGLNGEPQTPWLSYISNATLLGLNLLLAVGLNISSKIWLRYLIFIKD